ncbi:S9 family peptidase [Pontibacter sp. G13]|uniref:S9 family peptidase n=1 Tax=Pontibacter sp. G13 TaxID=3074898 RepID=UPI00288B64C9|nr:S9 family peptidase [Pontibacter sp. G13]WNJ21496.1 S9 family peptidase [Pontibacter sp. G13]
MAHSFPFLQILTSWAMALMVSLPTWMHGQSQPSLKLEDVFEIEYATHPTFTPDGQQIIYQRNFMDIMEDQRRSNLWMVDIAGKQHRPLTDGPFNDHGAQISPDGNRLLFISNRNGRPQLFIKWMDTGHISQLGRLTQSPANAVWSPDGSQIAFTMRVPEVYHPSIILPGRPAGATWAATPRVIDRTLFRRDGTGMLPKGFVHLFVMPAEGGTPRQVSSGNFNFGAPTWSPDGTKLLFSGNLGNDPDHDPIESEAYELDLASGEVKALTDQNGPNEQPRYSPDGKSVAYIGFEDQKLGYQNKYLFLIGSEGTPENITQDLDRSINSYRWAKDGKGWYISYDHEGRTRIDFVSRQGKRKVIIEDLGGTSIGRPYSGGSFTLGPDNQIAYTQSQPDHPADIGFCASADADPVRLTYLNADLLNYRETGLVEEFWYNSKHDQQKIQGWIVTPPGFDPSKKYPLLLEIHGGPFTNYGNRFSLEAQLYAAAGYVVLYTNPRGSTSYGEEFANLIHHNYPSEDFDDLMSGVDVLIARGYVDEDRLFVTGGSGGGVLTAWIIGKTDRFKAAVIAKPVINWFSFALTSDMYPYFAGYWFPGFPWEHPEHYMKRSPISLVGQVSTPTMLITGTHDLRTPMSESYQYYQALQLLNVESVLVQVPGAGHGIAHRPSQLMAKVAFVMSWFSQHGGVETP